MAGTQPGFDATVFRQGIRFVMDMAAPPDANDQVTFCYDSVLTYNKPVDGDDTPFDPAATVTRNTPDPKKVPCAVEYFDATGQEVVFGTITASRIAVTLLDDDYETIKGCSFVVLGGQRWIYKRTEPPGGLFDVGLWTLVFVAEDQV